jgi:hypothetical protein
MNDLVRSEDTENDPHLDLAQQRGFPEPGTSVKVQMRVIFCFLV